MLNAYFAYFSYQQNFNNVTELMWYEEGEAEEK